MKKGQNGEMARLKTAIVEYKDIYKLYPETWLNDEIINFYMELISDRANSENSNLPSVHCFNTFFCSTLREHGYAKVRRWTKRVDIFAKDLIFIPINYSYHWTLGVIDMRNKTIRIYDSLHGHHDSTLRVKKSRTVFALFEQITSCKMDSFCSVIWKMNIWTRKRNLST